MTTTLPSARHNGQVGRANGLVLPQPSPPRRASFTDRHPAWPIVLQLGGWPIWWASGIGDYSPILIAVPMLWQMYRWRAERERRIKLPPGFGWWLLFLVVMFAGAITLPLTAPYTEPGPVTTRLISWGLRAASYLAYAVLLVYAGNLTEKELPRRRLAWQLALVGLYSIGFGLVAMVIPSFHFTSPLAALVPGSLQNAGQGQIYAMLHPSMTQIENFMGHGRVTAPFLYANTWGNNVAILLPWLFVAWRSYGKPWQRKLVTPIIIVSIIPILFSFDRGLWVAIAVAIIYLAIRFAQQGKMAMLGGVIAAIIVGAVVYFASPVHTLVSQRLANATSDSARISLSILSTKDAVASPVIGYGDTRREWGSTKSISVGRTAKCSSCGQRSAGSNGQLWLLLITSGFLGTILYLGFFGYGMWRYWGDTSPYGLTGVLVLLLSFVFMFVYDAVGATLAFTVFAYALLWRNETHARSRPGTPEEDVAGQGTAGPGPGTVRREVPA